MKKPKQRHPRHEFDVVTVTRATSSGSGAATARSSSRQMARTRERLWRGNCARPESKERKGQ